MRQGASGWTRSIRNVRPGLAAGVALTAFCCLPIHAQQSRISERSAVIHRRIDSAAFGPLVIPVAPVAAPYGAEILWRAFSVGDAKSAAYRRQYQGGYCETTDFFLRRELGTPCRALVLAPWLEYAGAGHDSVLAVQVLEFADSVVNLGHFADSAGRTRPIVAAVVGDTGPTRLVNRAFRSRHATRPATVPAVVLTPLPRDSTLVDEDQFIAALPHFLGLSPRALYRDQNGAVHLHPNAFADAWDDAMVVLTGPATIEVDAGVHTCGHLNCVLWEPPHVFRLLAAHEPRDVYLSARFGQGILPEKVHPLGSGPISAGDFATSGERWLVPLHAPMRIALMAGVEVAIRWDSTVAIIEIPRLDR